MHANSDGGLSICGGEPRLVCIDLQRSRGPFLSNAKSRRACRYAATDASGPSDEGTWNSNDPGLFATSAGPQRTKLQNLAGTSASRVTAGTDHNTRSGQ